MSMHFTLFQGVTLLTCGSIKYMNHQIKFDDDLVSAFKIMSKSKKHKLFRLPKEYHGNFPCFCGEYDDYDDDLRWADTDTICYP